MAMMGVLLNPTTCLCILVVDVVTKCLFLASSQVRLFVTEALVYPIGIKRHCFANPHCVDNPPLSSPALRGSPNNPVAHLCGAPNPRFACCEGAVAVKWIRCKAVVSCHDVRMQFQDLILLNMRIG